MPLPPPPPPLLSSVVIEVSSSFRSSDHTPGSLVTDEITAYKNDWIVTEYLTAYRYECADGFSTDGTDPAAKTVVTYTCQWDEEWSISPVSGSLSATSCSSKRRFLSL